MSITGCFRCRLTVLPVTIVLLTLVVFSAPVSFAQDLTLEESIAIALERNPSVRVADEELRRSDARIREATAVGMPKLSLDANYQRVDSVPRVTFGEAEIDLGSIDNRSADLLLVQPIDVFGGVRTAGRAARVARQTSEHGYDRQVNDTILDTKLAFYNVLRAQRFVKVQEDTIAQLESHLRDAESHYAAGTIAKFDVLRAETQLANARQGLISAQNAVELAKAAFNNVLGWSVDTPVGLVEPEPPGLVNPDLDACVQYAREWRPEVLQAKTAVELGEDMARVAKLSAMPRFYFRWAYNRNFDTSMFNPKESSWIAFLTASVSLYDGGANRAAIDQAQSDVNTSKYLLEQVTNGVLLDARQSYLSLRESRERIEAADKALEQARESMRLAQVRYKAGVSTQVELLDAQVALTLAETNRVSALYDYQSSLARLERAVGGAARLEEVMSGVSVAYSTAAHAVR